MREGTVRERIERVNRERERAVREHGKRAARERAV
jgi:hypothetical protein